MSKSDLGLIAVIGIIAYFLMKQVGDMGKGVSDAFKGVSDAVGKVSPDRFFEDTGRSIVGSGQGMFDFIGKDIPEKSISYRNGRPYTGNPQYENPLSDSKIISVGQSVLGVPNPVSEQRIIDKAQEVLGSVSKPDSFRPINETAMRMYSGELGWASKWNSPTKSYLNDLFPTNKQLPSGWIWGQL